MRMTRRSLALALTSVLVLAACGQGNGSGSNQGGMEPVKDFASVTGTYWGSAVKAPKPMVGTEQALQIRDDGFRLWVGCNVFDVTGKVDNRLLIVDRLSVTDEKCSDALAAQDKWIGEYLMKKPQVDQGGPMVAFNWDDGWFGFEKSNKAFPAPGAVAEVPGSTDLTPISGVWTASDVNKAPQKMVPGAAMTMTILSDRLMVSAGCNTLAGSARLSDNILITNGLSMTEMGCDKAFMEQDDWLSKLFAGNQTKVSQDGEKLTLSWDSGSIDFTLTGPAPRPAANPDEPVSSSDSPSS